MAEIDEVLLEHNPRPTNDPLYVPWWAKGEYARVNKTRYTLADGTLIECGKVVRRAPRKGGLVAPPYRPEPEVANATEVPRKAHEIRDEAREAFDACVGVDQVYALLERWHLSRDLWDLPAPNNGVRKMRVLNQVRKAMRL